MLTCRAECFGHEALQTIYRTRLLDDIFIESTESPMFLENLEARTLSDASGKNGLNVRIRLTAQALLAGDDTKDEQRWRTYIHALCQAVQILWQGQEKTASTLLGSEDAIDIQPGEMSHHTLAAAAYTGNLTIVQQCLNQGCDPNVGSECFGRPLPMAASGGHFDIVKLLLEHKANHLQGCDPRRSLSKNLLITMVSDLL